MLALGAAAGSRFDPAWLDWQPGLALREPWRWWSAAFVHWSDAHLVMNLVGAALVALLGWRGGLGPRAAAAWALAWPLTQLGLLAQPGLRHYGGLSGVLHAGVAIAACVLLRSGEQRGVLIGRLLGVGLLLKIALEQPWGPPTRVVVGWDFALAPAAHASGVLAGVLAWWIVCRRQPHLPMSA
ncbi:MAG: rhombosortase [Vitreoscilla sp.]|nr:rhombosortase [Vitreoscilla sp.]